MKYTALPFTLPTRRPGLRTTLALAALLALGAAPLYAQSLYLAPGENAVEASAGWSVGPFSTGVEAYASAGIGGRVDVGLAFNRHEWTYDDGTESVYNEYAPFVRYFAVKQADGGAPVSLAFAAQLFLDSYETDEEGHYAQVSTTAYRLLRLTDRFALQPFVGFGLVAEWYAAGGASLDRTEYLTRDLGLHLTTAPDRPWVLRLSLVEQSWRDETYRVASAAVLRRL